MQADGVGEKRKLQLAKKSTGGQPRARQARKKASGSCMWQKCSISPAPARARVRARALAGGIRSGRGHKTSLDSCCSYSSSCSEEEAAEAAAGEESEVPLADKGTQCDLLPAGFLAALLGPGGEPLCPNPHPPVEDDSVFDVGVSAPEQDPPEPPVVKRKTSSLLRKLQLHKPNSPSVVSSTAEVGEPVSPGLVGVDERQERPYDGVLCPNYDQIPRSQFCKWGDWDVIFFDSPPLHQQDPQTAQHSAIVQI